MLAEVVAWLLIGPPALVALHEAAHFAIARLHGHRVVCVAVNPIGIAVLFEDAPRVGYRLAQAVVPALVTWAAAYAWLAGTFAALASYTPLVPLDEVLARLPWTASLFTLLTSGADLAGACLDLARPVRGPARVERGLASLRAVPSLVLFTPYGRRRWQGAWLATRLRGDAGAPVLRRPGRAGDDGAPPGSEGEPRPWLSPSDDGGQVAAVHPRSGRSAVDSAERTVRTS
jgi:hypothetical protein